MLDTPLADPAILAVGLAVFAAIDEVTQPWFGRSAEPLDWVYDLIGVATGIAVIAVMTALLKTAGIRPAGPA